MNWRHLIWIPLAALSLGESNHVPRFRAAIAQPANAVCPYEDAKRNYLLAYAYWQEQPLKASEFLTEAERQIKKCGEGASDLHERIGSLQLKRTNPVEMAPKNSTP